MEPLDFRQVVNLNVKARYIIKRHANLGFKVETRVIADHELVYIVAGEGTFVIEGREHIAKAGMLFYFYPRLVHSIDVSKENTLVFYAVHFDFDWNGQTSLFRLPLSPVYPMHNNALLKKLFSDLYDAWSVRRTGYLFKSNNLVQQIIYEALWDSHNQQFSFKNSQRMELLLAYIEENYKNKITTEDLCALVHVKSTYLNNIFKQQLGEKPMDYVNRYRINKAKEYLYFTELKIKEIGVAVGIQDAYYFSKLFQKYEGISPNAYRKQIIQTV